MNKDFYDDLPVGVDIILDSYISKYGKEDWFEEAWGKYREHIKTSSMDEVRMPAYVFSKYISEMEDK